MAKAKPDKKYDLSKYINNALSMPENGSMISTGQDTDNDNYLFAQSVVDLDIDTPDEQVVKWLSKAKSICNDVIKLSGSTDIDYLVPADSGKDNSKDNISLAQALYLIGLSYGLKPYQILDMLKLSKICPVLWSKNPAYKEKLEAVKQMKIEQLEAVTIDNALNNPNANIERMFVLKAWMPKYKDNAPLPTAPSVSIHISIDGENISEDMGRRTYDVTDSE